MDAPGVVGEVAVAQPFAPKLFGRVDPLQRLGSAAGPAEVTNAFAFAFWGGDVYFFTETFSGSGNSQVTRLDYDGNDGGGLRPSLSSTP